VVSEVEGHGFGEADDGKFGHAVGVAIANADDAADGGDIDDRAGFVFDHGGDEGFGEMMDAFDVDGVEAVEVFFGGSQNCADMANARVVDEDVEVRVIF